MCNVSPSCLLSVPLPTGRRCHCPVPLCPHCSSTSRGGDGALGVVVTPLGSSSWWLSGLGVRWENRGTEGQAQAETPLQGPSCTLRHRHRGHRPSAAAFSSCQGSRGHRQPEPQGPAPRGQGSLEQERRWKQYLEDERIALFLQNEEFMKELQRNRDFLLALERDRLKYESKKSKSTSVAVSNDFGFSSVISGDAAPSVTSEAGGAVSDDALFRDKLKHMGKSTRKKLFELARAFSEKTKMRKSKRKHLLKHQVLGTAASTANLLDDVEGHSCDEDFQARRQQLREEEETPKEGQ